MPSGSVGGSGRSQYGSAARELYDAARALLDRIVAEKRLRASAVYGFWPAVSE